MVYQGCPCEAPLCPRQSPAEYKETLALMFKPKVLKSPLQNGCCTPIKKKPLSKKTLFPEIK